MNEIDPHRLYSADELKDLIGRRTVERLREHGLAALGGQYLGQNAIDAWLKAADAQWRERRGLEEAKPDARPEHRTAQRFPKPAPGTSLQEQLERSRQQEQRERSHHKIEKR